MTDKINEAIGVLCEGYDQELVRLRAEIERLNGWLYFISTRGNQLARTMACRAIDGQAVPKTSEGEGE